MEDGSCGRLRLLRSTAQQRPGAGDLVTMGMRQTLLSPPRLSGRGNGMTEGTCRQERDQTCPRLPCPLIASSSDCACVRQKSVKTRLMDTFESFEGGRVSVTCPCRKPSSCSVRTSSGVSSGVDLSCCSRRAPSQAAAVAT